MRSRNVLISLLLVLALLVFSFIRIHYFEPKKRHEFNRNPSRIEYSELALCQMDCHHANANEITAIIRTGLINKTKTNMREKPFPVFAVEGIIKQNIHLGVIVVQNGRVAKIKSCYRTDATFVCNCPGETTDAISFFKSNNQCSTY